MLLDFPTFIHKSHVKFHAQTEADETEYRTRAYGKNKIHNTHTFRGRDLIDGVLVVSILAIVEVIAVPIIVNDKEDGRVVPNAVVIVRRPIVSVERL